MLAFQSEGEPVHLHTFREFPSFPGQLPLPTTFERNAGTGAARRRQPGFRAICKGGRSAARRVSSSGKAAPHARAPEDRAGRAAQRPLKARNRREERPGYVAHLAGTLPPHLRSRSRADALPEAVRTPRIGSEGSGRRGMGKEPLTATPGAELQVGASPRGVPGPRQAFGCPQPRGRGASLRCAGMTGRPRPPRPLDPVTPPSPPHRSWTGRKVLESLGGRQVFAGRLPWCT